MKENFKLDFDEKKRENLFNFKVEEKRCHNEMMNKLDLK
jgi:hypothetical protein